MGLAAQDDSKCVETLASENRQQCRCEISAPQGSLRITGNLSTTHGRRAPETSPDLVDEGRNTRHTL